MILLLNLPFWSSPRRICKVATWAESFSTCRDPSPNSSDHCGCGSKLKLLLISLVPFCCDLLYNGDIDGFFKAVSLLPSLVLHRSPDLQTLAARWWMVKKWGPDIHNPHRESAADYWGFSVIFPIHIITCSVIPDINYEWILFPFTDSGP